MQTLRFLTLLNLCLMILTMRISKNKVQQTAYKANSLLYFNVNWSDTSLTGAADIGIGSEGDAYVAGLDGNLYSYDLVSDTYTKVTGNTSIAPITRVDVDMDGIPYVVCNTGDTYYLDCDNNWNSLSGCANDIGVGRGGEVWKVGCDSRPGGYGIWKLFCPCKCEGGCDRKCMKYKKMNYVSNITTIKKNKCFWYRIEGGAFRLDVNPEGNPWVLTDKGDVYGYDGVNWHYVKGVQGLDITVSNESMTFVVGLDKSIYALNKNKEISWTEISGAGLQISAGPLSQPWIVGSDNNVRDLSKRAYN